MIDNQDVLVTKDSSRTKKDARQRLLALADWLTQNNLPWYAPDLDAYRDYLLDKGNLSKGSVAAHIGTIRTRYQELLNDNAVIQKLHALARDTQQPEEFVASAMETMTKATSKESGWVEYKRQQPQFNHLNAAQLGELFAQPDIRTLQGIRDVLAIGLIFATGMNETELCAIQVSDFHRKENGDLQVKVPAVLEGTARTVVIRDYELFSLPWIEDYIAAWFHYANLEQGNIMRGFFRGGMKMNTKEVTPRGIQKMLKSYVVHDLDSEEINVTALDLRHTYARWLFLQGIEFETIQKSLGHSSPATTLEYIGLPSQVSQNPADLKVSTEPLLIALHKYWPSARNLVLSSGE